MAAIADSVLHFTFARVTRLDSVGNPVAGPNNLVVTDKAITLTITPDVLAGEQKDTKGGNDRLLNTYRGQDIVRRRNLELDVGVDQEALAEILTGAAAITDTGGDPIGVQFNSPCDFDSPFLAFEGWQDLWDCDHQPSDPYRYLLWVFPSSRWIDGPTTAHNDFTPFKFHGYTVGNANWGEGIYGDYPEAVGAAGARFFTNTVPTAENGWQSQGIT